MEILVERTVVVKFKSFKFLVGKCVSKYLLDMKGLTYMANLRNSALLVRNCQFEFLFLFENMKKSFLQFVRKTKNQPLHPIILWIYTQNDIDIDKIR